MFIRLRLKLSWPCLHQVTDDYAVLIAAIYERSGKHLMQNINAVYCFRSSGCAGRWAVFLRFHERSMLQIIALVL